MDKLQISELSALFRKRIKQHSFEELLEVYRPLFEDADNAVCLGLYLRLKHGEHRDYASFNYKPTDYRNSREFLKVHQCAKLFSKYPFLETGIDIRHAAITEYIRCEVRCREVNAQIFSRGFRSLFKREDEWQVIHLAISKIAHVLGDRPPLDSLNFHFGPGQNIGLVKNNTSMFSKLSASRTITQDLLALLKDDPINHPAWDCAVEETVPSVDFRCLSTFEVVPGSKLSFVPKNAKTERPICTEPLYNSFVQTGIGKHIGKRLLRQGVDLTTQTNNQQAARKGSLDGSVATIDLKSASDMISWGVILNMVPFDWFKLMDAARSHRYSFDGGSYVFSKFSSMGNAFTFELESLLFWAIASCSVDLMGRRSDDVVCCFGDDIAVPTRAYDLVTRTLSSLGFDVNHDKSYCSGPFRESCGKDFFLGHQVRPFYLKKSLSPEQIFVQLNFIRRFSGPQFEDPLYRRCHSSLIKALPPLFRENLKHFQGPDGFGDGHLICAWENRPKLPKHPYTKRKFEGAAFWTFQSVALKDNVGGRFHYAWAIAKALWGSGRAEHDFTSVRSHTRVVLRKQFQRWSAS